MPEPKIIEGQIVDAPRVLAAAPAERRVPDLRCDTHPTFLDCQLSRPDCIGFAVMDQPDRRTWQEKAVTFIVRDRRWLSYPRLGDCADPPK